MLLEASDCSESAVATSAPRILFARPASSSSPCFIISSCGLSSQGDSVLYSHPFTLCCQSGLQASQLSPTAQTDRPTPLLSPSHPHPYHHCLLCLIYQRPPNTLPCKGLPAPSSPNTFLSCGLHLPSKCFSSFQVVVNIIVNES